jgi:hypothetical protein
VRQRIRSHLTYANVMATIAVFLILSGGTAVALNGTNTVQSDDLGPGAQVKAPDVAANAVKGTNVVDGSISTTDLTPAARGARAYGRVDFDGNLTRSKNVVSVSHPQNGVYCITLGGGINPATAVLIAGLDYSNNYTNTTLEDTAVVEWDAFGSACPSGELAVYTFLYNGDPTDNNTGTGDSTGDDLASHSESFAFVVP